LIHGALEVRNIKGLAKVVESTQAHGFDGTFHTAMAGDHDDRSGRQFGATKLDDVEPVGIWNEEVHDEKPPA